MLGLPRLFFDAQDDDLVARVNAFPAAGRRMDHVRGLFDAYLHPRGIKELAASSERRIAYAVISLVGALEGGTAEERLAALRCVRDEVLHNSSVSLRLNTGRVLLEIMKHVVREHEDPVRQRELAHDFFAAASGRAAAVRRALREYHLVEMPEEWNQVAFDYHVHDARTKGRKSPTHLVTDAWIKGIRQLQVVYYNFIPVDAAAELTEAASIMGVDVRIGIQIPASFRGRRVGFIWAPRGFVDRDHFLAFLDAPAVRELFDQGREVAEWKTRHVLALLDSFNRRHLGTLRDEYGVDVSPLQAPDFLAFVGPGQASVVHLADYIHQLVLPGLKQQAGALEPRLAASGPAERKAAAARMEVLDCLLPETIADRWLRAEQNPEVADIKRPSDDDPELLRLSVPELISRLGALHSGYRLTLNPTGLTPADVLEILHDARGAVTHIEIFNLKDYLQKKSPHASEIGRLRRTLNTGNQIALKQLVRECIAQAALFEEPDHDGRMAKLGAIVRDIPKLSAMYRHTPLKGRIGSDSAGRARSLFGMGLVVRETLPPRERAKIGDGTAERKVIPVTTRSVLQTLHHPRESHLPAVDAALRLVRRIPGLDTFGYRKERAYLVDEKSTRLNTPGNIVALGGVPPHPGNGLRPEAAPEPSRLRYLSTTWRNLLKVLVGFLPAFLTFYLTKDWWVLQYFGAVIWFGITGLRNVVQSVVGGGGLSRSQFVTWNSLVSWERVCDSLLFTGFSVPLLDWLVKGVLLSDTFGVTTATAPIALYTTIALVNGTYLVTHNKVRGLPRAAVIGNFFRSVFSIPLAVGLSFGLHALMVAWGSTPDHANAVLQLSAAVVAKFASDVVAGLIEGAADRGANIARRIADYREKIAQVVEIHGRLEALFPDRDVLEMAAAPKALEGAEQEPRELARRLIINALDLMHFWMVQPRARLAFRKVLDGLSPEERRIVLRSQRVLGRTRNVTEMFLDHLVGGNFARPLAFYLDRSPSYLKDLGGLAAAVGVSDSMAPPLSDSGITAELAAVDTAAPPGRVR